MSRTTFTTIDAQAELKGPERHYAGWIVRSIAEALTPRPEFGSPPPEVEFEKQLNTAILIGNDAVILLARLHGQCEIHGYVEGPNRAWLAGIVDGGLASGILRESMGWEGVAELLRASEEGPVVTSYSVTDSFPGQVAAGWGGWEPEHEDGWYELDGPAQWELAVKGIRGYGCEWTPEKWRKPNFEDGSTVLTPKGG